MGLGPWLSSAAKSGVVPHHHRPVIGPVDKHAHVHRSAACARDGARFAADNMIGANLHCLEFEVAGTGTSQLPHSRVSRRIQLGPNIPNVRVRTPSRKAAGLGRGSNPHGGKL